MSSLSPRTAPVPGPSADTDRLRQLGALRAELDQIDDSMHDLLMRRAELVSQVGALGAKGRVPLRPGREASILRRLLARNHGALAPATLVRVWREMLAGSSAQQQAMCVVVGDPALRPAVCEHFGALMQAEALPPAAAIAQVRDGTATLAVMPMPADGVRWWAAIPDDDRWPRIHVVARLPFWARPGLPEALVISTAEPDPSGHDRSLIAAPPGILESAGFKPGTTLATDGPIILAEVDGLITPNDERLRSVPATVLGAYAIQIGESA